MSDRYSELYIDNAKTGANVLLLEFSSRVKAVSFAKDIKGVEFKTRIVDRNTSSVFDSLFEPEAPPALVGIENW